MTIFKLVIDWFFLHPNSIISVAPTILGHFVRTLWESLTLFMQEKVMMGDLGHYSEPSKCFHLEHPLGMLLLGDRASSSANDSIISDLCSLSEG